MQGNIHFGDRIMKQYQCRRKLKIDVQDDENREIIGNVTVVNPETKFCLHIPECLTCKFGTKAFVLKEGDNPSRQTYTIKACRMRLVK